MKNYISESMKWDTAPAWKKKGLNYEFIDKKILSTQGFGIQGFNQPWMSVESSNETSNEGPFIRNSAPKYIDIDMSSWN